MRRGFALPFVIMIMAAVSLLTVASLTLATHETIIAAAQAGMMGAATSAAHGLDELRRDWPQQHFDSMPVGARQTLARVGAEISLSRTSWGTFHARSVARAGRLKGVSDAVFRTIDFGWALSELSQGVIAAGPLRAEQAIMAVDDTSRCTLPEAADTGAGDRPLPAGYALGGVRWEELASIADSVVSGARAWDGIETAHAAPRLFYAPSDLEITAGSGHGLLLVDGDLTLHGGTAFTGIVVVRGTVMVHDGAYIFGALRVQGAGPSVIGAAEITHSRCASARALLASPAAKRLIKAQRLFIPVFPP